MNSIINNAHIKTLKISSLTLQETKLFFKKDTVHIMNIVLKKKINLTLF